MVKIRSKFTKMPVLELVLENAWKNDEKPCLWILKTVVSHGRGCIFQGLQCLQKVWKTTPEIVLKRTQNPLKTGSQGSPKRSLQMQ